MQKIDEGRIWQPWLWRATCSSFIAWFCWEQLSFSAQVCEDESYDGKGCREYLVIYCSSLTCPIAVTVDIIIRLVLQLEGKDRSKWSAVAQELFINQEIEVGVCSFCFQFQVIDEDWRINSISIVLLLRFRQTWICKMCKIQCSSFRWAKICRLSSRVDRTAGLS